MSWGYHPKDLAKSAEDAKNQVTAHDFALGSASMHGRCLIACALAAFSKFAVAASLSSVDCADKIPRELANNLVITHPELSVPTMHDLDPANVGYDVKSGGDGCYVVAKGSFIEASKVSFALLFTDRVGRPLLAVASKRANKWFIQRLPTFCDDIKFCYVKRRGSGTYSRSEALDTKITSDSERVKLRSEHDVVVSGRVESTGVTYINKSGRWLYVWTFD